MAGFKNIESITYDDPRSVRCWLIYTKLLFDFHVKQPIFCFIRKDGNIIAMPDMDGTTDFASTPPPLWGIPMFSPWRFKYSATIHDQGYLHHWLYINGVRVNVSRDFMDQLLEEMIEHEPDKGNKVEAWIYLKGVQLGGRFAWGKGDKTTPLIRPQALPGMLR